MILEPTFVADALVNLFGAGGAVVVASELQRSDPKGPLAKRIIIALWCIALLFVTRTWSWYSNGILADALADAMASATPLVSLLVAEGLLRRHAPRWLKTAVVVGPLLAFSIKLLPFLPPQIPVILLLVTVLGGFSAIATLLWRRDTASLTAPENATIRRVLMSLLLLTPLILTDFRSIWPNLPVRLGALGALLLLYVGLGVGNFHAPLRGRLFNISIFALTAAAFAGAYVATGHADGGATQMLRATAVGLAGLLFAGLFSEAQGAQLERNRQHVSVTEAQSPSEFARLLSAHTLLSGAQMLPPAALEHVDHPAFRSLLAREKTLRRAAAPWGRSASDDGVERAQSLLSAYAATHLTMLSENPLRLLAISLPATASDARAELEIALVRLVGERIYASTSHT